MEDLEGIRIGVDVLRRDMDMGLGRGSCKWRRIGRSKMTAKDNTLNRKA